MAKFTKVQLSQIAAGVIPCEVTNPNTIFTRDELTKALARLNYRTWYEPEGCVFLSQLIDACNYAKTLRELTNLPARVERKCHNGFSGYVVVINSCETELVAGGFTNVLRVYL